MRRAARVLAVLSAVWLVVAPSASAQGGNGLYEPFPKAAVEKRAERFVERLRFGEPVRFSDDQLERGAFVDPSAVQIEEGLRGGSGPGRASARAGVDERGPDVPAIAQIAIVALAIAALPLLAARRPRRRVAPG
jgi:hypothetical protein